MFKKIMGPYYTTEYGVNGQLDRECRRLRVGRSMKKLSGWFKRIQINNDLKSKTHKIFDGPSIYQEDTKLLASRGSGTICVRLEKSKAFNLDLIATNALLRLTVNQQSVKLYCIYRGRFILLKEDTSKWIGLETDTECLYWISFHANSRSVMFGKQKPSFDNVEFIFRLPKSNKAPEQYWMNKISHYRIDTPASVYLSKCSIKREAPMKAGINLLTAHP